MASFQKVPREVHRYNKTNRLDMQLFSIMKPRHRLLAARAFFAMIAMLAVSPSTAATWYIFREAIGSKTVYYFDADSVLKRGSNVTVWIKSVQLNTPKKDNSWATAQHSTYDCSQRTVEMQSYANYDKYGKFLYSGDIAKFGKVDVIPDSVGESIFQGVCAPEFANSESPLYLKIIGNDVFAFTKSLNESINAREASKK